MLPNRFVARLRTIYPDRFEKILTTFDAPRRVAFRINPLKVDPDEALRRLRQDGLRCEPVGWYDLAFTLPSDTKEVLVRHPLFVEGCIYIQSLSSMLAPLVLAPQPGETILDLAAAPGGKALMMAAMMRNRGWLSVVEPGKDRFFRLKRNLENGGVTIAHHYMTDGRSVGAKCPAMFDRVMLDAPCSTEAKFKSYEPATSAYWSERKIKEMAKLQNRLLHSAIKSLRPGGRLLYATCSFAPEENESVIDKALRKHPDLSLLPIDLPLANSIGGLQSWNDRSFHPDVVRCVRILPDESMEGFFLALFEKGKNDG